MNSKVLLLLLLLFGCVATQPSNAAASEDDLPKARILMTDVKNTKNLLKAKAFLTTIIARQPNNSDAYCLRGLTKCWTDDWPAGIADLKHATVLKPSNHDAWIHLSNATAREGRWAEAWHASDQAIKLKPGESGGYICQAKMYDINGRTDDAIKLLREAQARERFPKVETDELIYEFCTKIATHALQKQEIALARRYLNQSPQPASKLGDFRRLEASTLIEEKRYDQALAVLKAIPKPDPREVSTILTTANVYLRKGDPAKAAQLLDSVKSRCKNELEWWHLQTALAQKTNNTQLRREALANCIRLTPNDPYWLRLQSAEFIVDGRYNDAAIELEKARCLAPGDRAVLADQLNLFRKTGDHRKTRLTLDRLLKAMSQENQQSLEFEATADLYAAAGRKDDAVDLYSKCLLLEPRNDAVRVKRNTLGSAH